MANRSGHVPAILEHSPPLRPQISFPVLGEIGIVHKKVSVGAFVTGILAQFLLSVSAEAQSPATADANSPTQTVTNAAGSSVGDANVTPTAAAMPKLTAQDSAGESSVQATRPWSGRFPTITLPKPTLPRFDWARANKRDVEPDGAGQPSRVARWWNSSTAALASGAEKFSTGTKKAWQGAKQMLRRDDREKNSSRKSESSVWQRLFAPQAESNEPRTIKEFMAQKRIRH